MIYFRLGMMTVGLVASWSAHVMAVEPQWPTTQYDYVVLDQDLRTVLSQFGTNTGVRIVLSDAVQGRVHGRLPAGSAHAFLDDLTKSFGLDWYFDGAVMSVTAASEAQTKFVPLKGVSFGKLSGELSQAGLLDPRFKLSQGMGASVAIASGPPRFISLVEQAVATLLPESPAQPEPERTLVVFRGSSTAKMKFP